MTPQLVTKVKRQTWLLTYILLPLLRALDWLLCKRRFGLRLLDPNSLITRRLDPRRLMQKARAIAARQMLRIYQSALPSPTNRAPPASRRTQPLLAGMCGAHTRLRCRCGVALLKNI